MVSKNTKCSFSSSLLILSGCRAGGWVTHNSGAKLLNLLGLAIFLDFTKEMKNDISENLCLDWLGKVHSTPNFQIMFLISLGIQGNIA